MNNDDKVYSIEELLLQQASREEIERLAPLARLFIPDSETIHRSDCDALEGGALRLLDGYAQVYGPDDERTQSVLEAIRHWGRSIETWRRVAQLPALEFLTILKAALNANSDRDISDEPPHVSWINAFSRVFRRWMRKEKKESPGGPEADVAM